MPSPDSSTSQYAQTIANPSPKMRTVLRWVAEVNINPSVMARVDGASETSITSLDPSSFVERMNRRNEHITSLMNELTDDDITFEILPRVLGRPVLTKDELKTYFSGMVAIFKEYEFKILDAVESKDKVIIQAASSGVTHAGSVYANQQMSIFTFRPSDIEINLPRILGVKLFVDSHTMLAFWRSPQIIRESQLLVQSYEQAAALSENKEERKSENAKRATDSVQPGPEPSSFGSISSGHRRGDKRSKSVQLYFESNGPVHDHQPQ